MVSAGVTQCRVRSPRAAAANLASWSLPAFVVPTRCSGNNPLLMAAGKPHVLMHPRVAGPLSIQDGDFVQLELTEAGETCTVEVKVDSGASLWNCDVLIHNMVLVHEAISLRAGSTHEQRCKVTLTSGGVLTMPMQEMQDGFSAAGAPNKGSGCLYFCGASRNHRNNNKGPSGYGFVLTTGDHIQAGAAVVGAQADLVRGYSYFAKSQDIHEIEYCGLIDGLEWACRLKLERLCICGDSELVLRQISGDDDHHDEEPRLRKLLEVVQICFVLAHELCCTFRHISREGNRVADCLAHLAIDLRENVTACNWANIDELVRERL